MFQQFTRENETGNVLYSSACLWLQGDTTQLGPGVRNKKDDHHSVARLYTSPDSWTPPNKRFVFNGTMWDFF